MTILTKPLLFALYLALAVTLAACGGDDANADPNASPTPEPKPPEEQVQDIIDKRLPLGWSVKSLTLKSPSGAVEVDVASPYDFEFEKRPDYSQETTILGLCPRAFELSAINQEGLKLSFTINGANRQNFPSITCP